MNRRQIKYRGKSTKSGAYVFGSAYIHNDDAVIVRLSSGGKTLLQYIPVEPDSIGEYTGIRDTDSNEIYENMTVIDSLTNMETVVKFGFCKKYAFTGWYLENLELEYVTALMPSFADINSYLKIKK